MLKEVRNKLCRIHLTPYQLAFFINACFLLLYLCSSTMKYETSDDFLMEVITSGAYGGEPNACIMFMNPLIGVFLSALYRMSTMINWYFYFQVLVVYASLSVICAQLYRKRIDGITIFISLVFISFFSHDLYQLLQFTKTAVLSIACGEMLILKNMLAQDIKKKETGVGFLFLLIGLLIRKNCFLIVMAFAAVHMILWLWKQYRTRNLRFGISRCLLFTGMTCAIYGFVFASNSLYLSMHSDYAQYLDYQRYRSSIIDYEPASYSEIEPELKDIGISENDYLNLVLFQLGDETTYTSDTLMKIAQIVEEHSQPLSLHAFFNRIVNQHYERYLCVLGVLTLSVILCFLKRKRFFAILCQCFSAFALFIYLYIQHRVVYRVEYAVFLALAVNILLLFIMDDYERKERYQKGSVILSIILLSLSIPSFVPRFNYNYAPMFYSWENHISKYRASFQQNRHDELLAEIQNHPNHIYFMSFQTTIQTIYLNYDPRLSLQADSLFENAVYLGGVSGMHPVHKEWLLTHNLSENLDELLKDDVYLIDNLYAKVFLQFIKEHYEPNAKLDLYKEIDGFQIWKIHS